MEEKGYFNICEELWNNWKIDNEFIKQEISSSLFNFIKKAIHCPEPYLCFENTGDTNSTFLFLTTNPGSGDDIQLKNTIMNNNTQVKINDEYKQNASNLGMYYLTSNFLKGTPAKRIKSMDSVSKLFKCKGFMQIECFPFHSNNLPKKYKNEIIKLSKVEGTFINKYITSLREYCVDKNIIAISAANNQSLDNLNDWIKLQCEIMGLSLGNAKQYVLNSSAKGNISVSLLVDTSNKKFKAIYLRQGSTGFNGDKVIDIIKSESLARI